MMSVADIKERLSPLPSTQDESSPEQVGFEGPLLPSEMIHEDIKSEGLNIIEEIEDEYSNNDYESVGGNSLCQNTSTSDEAKLSAVDDVLKERIPIIAAKRACLDGDLSSNRLSSYRMPPTMLQSLCDEWFASLPWKVITIVFQVLGVNFEEFFLFSSFLSYLYFRSHAITIYQIDQFNYAGNIITSRSEQPNQGVD
jgi:hypothetical protein